MDVRELGRTLDATRDRGTKSANVAKPHLFLLIETRRPLAGGARWSLSDVDVVRIGRDLARGHRAVGRALDISVPDARMSSRHARIERSETGWTVVDEGSRNGTHLFTGSSGVQVERAELDDGAIIELGNTLFVFRDSLPTPARDDSHADGATFERRDPALATLLPAYAEVLMGLVRVAMSDVSILLRGESGTGKEVLARAIHAVSQRSGAFVPVNCGALPDTLVESSLFGHVKGSFSGATRDEPGFVRASDKGSLFLDEIGDLPKTSQAALLRVLQEREVVPVGATRAVKVDLRVVSATHRAIEESLEFRADLYARLAGFSFAIPPLRERREDLGVLVANILRKVAGGREVELSLACARALLGHDWPLNVRELQQALSVAFVLAREGAQDRVVIDATHLPESVRRKRESRRPVVTSEDEALRTSLIEALTQAKGNVSEVSRAMGKTRMQIHRWMKRFGIDAESYRR